MSEAPEAQSEEAPASARVLHLQSRCFTCLPPFSAQSWQSKHTCFPSPTACSQEPVSPAAHVHLHARSDSTCLVTCCVSLRQHPAVLSPSSSPSFRPPLKPRDSIP